MHRTNDALDPRPFETPHRSIRPLQLEDVVEQRIGALPAIVSFIVDVRCGIRVRNERKPARVAASQMIRARVQPPDFFAGRVRCCAADTARDRFVVIQDADDSMGARRNHLLAHTASATSSSNKRTRRRRTSGATIAASNGNDTVKNPKIRCRFSA